MSLDFQQVRQQILKFAETAPERSRKRRTLVDDALAALAKHHTDLDALREKIERAARKNPNLRCAVPAWEALDFRKPPPAPPAAACLLAVDGSQVNPSRHDQVEFALVNIGSISLPFGGLGEIRETVESELTVADDLYTEYGKINDQHIAARRDLLERKKLAALAETLPRPLFTFTDGALELWFNDSASRGGGSPADSTLDEYITALKHLHQSGVCTAGYVDRPSSALALRMLEIADLPEAELKDAGRGGKYWGLRDIDIFRGFLDPGERSAIFALRSRPTGRYTDDVALHFFYLNVGRPKKPYLARVEIPFWVAEDTMTLDYLHALLLYECGKLGNRRYPYILHRSHEIAVVTREEKRQIEQMLVQTLHAFDGGTHKQATKDAGGRTTIR